MFRFDLVILPSPNGFRLSWHLLLRLERAFVPVPTANQGGAAAEFMGGLVVSGILLPAGRLSRFRESELTQIRMSLLSDSCNRNLSINRILRRYLKPLFPHNLTPQKNRLLQRTLQGIYRQTLETSDLQLSLLYFRELKIDDGFREWGSAIAHGKRNQGLLWSRALNVWTTHLYYENLSADSLNVQALPYDVYKTILFLIENTAEWQLAHDLRDIYPSGITKADLLATLEHLYSRPRKSEETFVFLTSEKGNFEEDLQLMRYLVSYCEEMALQIPPTPMDDLVDALERGFARIDMSRRSFSTSDRIYLQLHLLVSFHNLLFDLNREFFKNLTGFAAPEAETMLSVSAMDDTLGLDVAFYQREDEKYLEQANIRSPNRLERFRTLLIATDLDEKKYLLESDRNIRGCLFNHPLEVRRHRGNPVIVALNRKNARFKPTLFRTGSASD